MRHNQYSLLILAISFLGLGGRACKDERLLDTEKYHRMTTEIAENMAALDSIYTEVGTEVCSDLLTFEEFRLRYDSLCSKIRRYDLNHKKKESITVDRNCVVKKEMVDLKDYAAAQFVRSELTRLDSALNRFSTDVKSYQKLIEQNCLKRLRECIEIKKNADNQAIIHAIEHLVVLKSRTEADLQADRQVVTQQLREFELLDKQSASPFYLNLLSALIEDVFFALSGRKQTEYCNAAHIRWSNLEGIYVHGDYPCERHYLNEVSNDRWPIAVDSQWVLEQIKYSKSQTTKRRGCLCENALNYDSLAIYGNRSCVGCADPLAINYCPDTDPRSTGPCWYAACKKRCYAEVLTDVKQAFPRFVEGRDSVLQVDSLCVENLCGCTNPCADNYNPVAKIAAVPDTCAGTICGCLDSTYVNYALRSSPDWIRRKYFNDKVTQHVQDSCHRRGCTSKCALNYDPLARVNDGSCECDPVTYEELDQLLFLEGWEEASAIHNPKKIKMEFDSFLQKEIETRDLRGIDRYIESTFEKIDRDLVVNVTASQMKIQSNGEMDGIALGEYNFRPVNLFIDVLLKYFDKKTLELTGSMLFVKIVGEADAHPIRGGGIPFENAGRPVVGERYRRIPAEQATTIKQVSQKNFMLAPNRPALNMEDGERFTDNEILAFLRAYMVKQKIMIATPRVEEPRIQVGVKVNGVKGSKYRRIGISLNFKGYYNEVGKEFIQQSANADSLSAAMDFYDLNGYPQPGKTYSSVPML